MDQGYGPNMARQAQTLNKKPIGFEARFINHEPVSDADFETIEASPTKAAGKSNPDLITKLEFNDGGQKSAGRQNGMSVFAKKSASNRADDLLAFYGFSACLVALSFWVSGGHSLFRNVDTMTTSALYSGNSSAEISDVAFQIVTLNGRSVLNVDGVVRNPGALAIHAKPVAVKVTYKDGSMKRYLLGQKGWTLGPRQEVVVSGRLDIASTTVEAVDIALTH